MSTTPEKRHGSAGALRTCGGMGAMSRPPSESVLRVQDALRALGRGHEIVDLGKSARTAADAAREVGCQVDQIVKSLVFRLRDSRQALLVVTSGAHRVDEQKVAALVGE